MRDSILAIDLCNGTLLTVPNEEPAEEAATTG